jgi:hypothetical protein
MTEKHDPSVAFGIAWGHFMRAGMLEDALMMATLFHRYADRQSDPILAENALDMIATSAQELRNSSGGNLGAPQKSGDRNCSFCGKSESAVVLGAGSNAFICKECARKFATSLAEPY